ncbi:MAG: HAD hydrolase family protein [Deltaproteobacteria bacterium]|nr:HAD hydrolase family protein [Deltaproteobacteria bacterium]
MSLTIPKPLALLMDFDGVLTDDTVYVDQDGKEMVRCHRGDGFGIGLLRSLAPIAVFSKERNPVVARRCEKLQIDCQHGIDDKLPAVTRYLAERQLTLDNAVFVGNDLNDLECVKAAGLGVAVADAHPDLCLVADLVLRRPGGQGAIRELIEHYLLPALRR